MYRHVLLSSNHCNYSSFVGITNCTKVLRKVIINEHHHGFSNSVYFHNGVDLAYKHQASYKTHGSCTHIEMGIAMMSQLGVAYIPVMTQKRKTMMNV